MFWTYKHPSLLLDTTISLLTSQGRSRTDADALSTDLSLCIDLMKVSGKLMDHNGLVGQSGGGQQLQIGDKVLNFHASFSL